MAALQDFSGIALGAELPILTIEIDRLALIKYAGAADDYVRQHWDHPYVVEQGYPDVIAHGWLSFAHMTRAVTDWVPSRLATVGDYAVRYHRPLHPGSLSCGGTVAEVADARAKFTLWARNGAGDTIATGKLTLLRNGDVG